ncbi:hypothetical protein [Phytobacter ursingii]|uniref:Uncharacterized protein n=1 Tax=Phytobacter ursingii TaxID=1972431 RepID=A0AB35RS80_9ENTR|nr:hypothetical protein [Phytobacter ursingii]MDV2861819.1 hypothetical protein [Phytobacter ursingii]
MKQVTMESVKQRIADLESAGKVVGGLSLSSEFELACLRELVAVTEQRDAMVAEMSHLWGFCKKAAFDADYEAELGMERGGFTDALNDIRTPAHDAAIAALRAEGVEMFAEHLSGMGIMASETSVKEFARQLRESKSEGAKS